MSKHLVLVLQSRQTLFNLRVLLLQLLHPYLQLTQVCLLSLPCLLGRNPIPQQPVTPDPLWYVMLPYFIVVLTTIIKSD
ncbi:hypothetical protein Hanom_Chr00s000005g01612291 [Helianthus anomalus]